MVQEPRDPPPRWHAAAPALDRPEFRGRAQRWPTSPPLGPGSGFMISHCPSPPRSGQSLYQLGWPRAEPTSDSQKLPGHRPSMATMGRGYPPFQWRVASPKVHLLYCVLSVEGQGSWYPGRRHRDLFLSQNVPQFTLAPGKGE